MTDTPHRDLIVVGTSMGGIDALKVLVGGLPADLPAAVCAVLHVGEYGIGFLPEILKRAGPLPAANAHDRMPLEPGRVYIAPPDQHLIVERPGLLRLSRGPKENRTRPAVDPLFRSAAIAYGPRTIGVVLTGGLDDGSAGLWAVKEHGGLAIVQDPADAIAPDMPRNAMKYVKVDYCVPLPEIPLLLNRFTRDPIAPIQPHPMSPHTEFEVKIAAGATTPSGSGVMLGEPSVFACPECHGVLMQLNEGNGIRFRCHTGHAYSTATLLAEFHDKTEDALWNAIRAIEENVLLLRRLAAEAPEGHESPEATALRQGAEKEHQRAELVRHLVSQPAEPTS